MRIAAAALAALSAATALATGHADLWPLPERLASWHSAEETRVFSGSELYGYIDGGAEIFLEFGFEQVTVQPYISTAGEIVVECYRMRDPLAALGTYLLRCGRETPAAGLSERHTAGRYQLLMVRNRYLVIVNNPAGPATLAPALVDFARAIAAQLPAGAPVTAFDALPTTGLIEGSQRLIRGSIALDGIATLGRGDVLQLRTGLTAVAAEYNGPMGRRTLIVATYPDPTAAAEAFRHLVAGLDQEITPLAQGTSHLVFRDYDGSFGEAQVKGTRLAITLRLAKPPAAQ